MQAGGEGGGGLGAAGAGQGRQPAAPLQLARPSGAQPPSRPASPSGTCSAACAASRPAGRSGAAPLSPTATAGRAGNHRAGLPARQSSPDPLTAELQPLTPTHPPAHPPRSVEELKERYYTIGRKLMVAREGGEAAVANQLLIKYPYNAQHERARKQAFHTLLTRCGPRAELAGAPRPAGPATARCSPATTRASPPLPPSTPHPPPTSGTSGAAQVLCPGGGGGRAAG
jgi:hypothetical protein